MTLGQRSVNLEQWRDGGLLGNQEVIKRQSRKEHKDTPGPNYDLLEKKKASQFYFTPLNTTILTSTVSMNMSQACFWFGVGRMLG